MTVELVLAGPFIQELAQLNQHVEDVVWQKLTLVQSFPGVGSSLVDPMLVQAFGPSVLKVAAGAYDVLYEREPIDDDYERVNVLGIIPQRAIR